MGYCTTSCSHCKQKGLVSQSDVVTQMVLPVLEQTPQLLEGIFWNLFCLRKSFICRKFIIAKYYIFYTSLSCQKVLLSPFTESNMSNEQLALYNDWYMLFCPEVAILNKQVHVVLGAKYSVLTLTFEIERVYLSHSTAVIYCN